jgi:hypothetical protein
MMAQRKDAAAVAEWETMRSSMTEPGRRACRDAEER